MGEVSIPRSVGLFAPLALLAACATTPVDPPLSPGAHYVALGSSYAAGANIPPLAPDRPARCGASQASYSRLLTADLGLDLTDASCGGATIAHLLAGWDELPAQVEAVNSATRLVTVTIGGNDLNYMGLMFAASCHARNERARLAEDCATVTLPTEDDYRAVEDRLTEALGAIRARAPHARVVLVQYVTLVPDRPCQAADLLPADAQSLRIVAERLARASSNAAMRASVEVLPVDRLSQGHTACDAEPWAHGFGEGYDSAAGAPWHPSATGHAAIANALAKLLAAPAG